MLVCRSVSVRCLSVRVFWLPGLSASVALPRWVALARVGRDILPANLGTSLEPGTGLQREDGAGEQRAGCPQGLLPVGSGLGQGFLAGD